MGAIANDGGMGTSLSEIGDTVEGTAQMDTQEATMQDFKIEESDSPVQSIKTEADKITFSWSTYANNAATLQRMFGGTIASEIPEGRALTLGAVTDGTLYTAGTYNNVPLTGGSGTGATANITFDSGSLVTLIVLVNGGEGYEASDVLGVSASDVGGTGSGFAVVVNSVHAGSPETWHAPDSIPEIEQSMEMEWKQGGKIKIPRAKVSAKLTMAFKRTALSQIDITATVLQPTKVGEPRMSILSPMSS